MSFGTAHSELAELFNIYNILLYLMLHVNEKYNKDDIITN